MTLMTVDDKYCHYQLALSVTADLREIYLDTGKTYSVIFAHVYIIISNRHRPTLIKYDQ